MSQLRFDYFRIKPKLVQQRRGADSEAVRDYTLVGEARPFKCSGHCTVGLGTVRAASAVREHLPAVTGYLQLLLQDHDALRREGHPVRPAHLHLG
jgi:hypothetical protein